MCDDFKFFGMREKVLGIIFHAGMQHIISRLHTIYVCKKKCLFARILIARDIKKKNRAIPLFPQFFSGRKRIGVKLKCRFIFSVSLHTRYFSSRTLPFCAMK